MTKLNMMVLSFSVELWLIFSICLFFSCTTTSRVTNYTIDVEDYRDKHHPSSSDDELLKEILSLPGNKRVQFSKKKYLLSSSLSLPSNLVIEGRGAEFIFTNSLFSHLINIQKADNIELSNLSISAVGEARKLLYAFRLEDASHCSFKKIRIHNSRMSGFSVKMAQWIRFDDCTFINLSPHIRNNVDGVFIGGSHIVSNIQFSNCQFINIGGQTKQASGFSQDGDGIQILASPSNKEISDISIEGCHFEKCSARGIKIQSGKKIQIKNNQFIQCSKGVSFALDQSVWKVRIEGNYVKNSGLAFSVYSTNKDLFVQELSLVNNSASNCNYFIRAGPPIIKGQIIGNQTKDLGYCFFSGVGLDLKISNNHIEKWGMKNNKSFDMAIYVASNSKSFEISENTFTIPNHIGRGLLVKEDSQLISIINNKFFKPLDRSLPFRMIQSSVKDISTINIKGNEELLLK